MGAPESVRPHLARMYNEEVPEKVLHEAVARIPLQCNAGKTVPDFAALIGATVATSRLGLLADCLVIVGVGTDPEPE